MATFSLEQLKETVERNFAPVIIEAEGRDSFKLVNLLRLPEKKRERVMELLESLDSDDSSEVASSVDNILTEVITIITAEDRGKELIKLVGSDTATLTTLMNVYQEGSELGELDKS